MSANVGFDQFFTHESDVGANQGGFASKGDLILNPIYNASYYTPTWDGKVTIVRLLPFFTDRPEGRTEVPYRGGAGYTKFSNWVRTYPAFRSIGQKSKATILLNDPYACPIWDQNSNPVCIFVREIRNAIAHAKKNNMALPPGRRMPNGSTVLPPYWLSMIEGSQGKGADIPNISSVALFECLIYQHSSKKDGINSLPIGLRPDDGPVVFELSGPTWLQTLKPLIDEVNPAYQATTLDSYNFEHAYINGDPLSLLHGRFLHIYREGEDPRKGAAAVADPSAMYSQGGQTQQAQGFQKKGYGCFFTRTLPGYPTDNGALTAKLSFPESPEAAWVENTIKNRWVPLDKLIRVPTPDEQARVLSNLFPAEMLLYAWEGCPQFISDELRAAANAVDLSASVHQPQTAVPTSVMATPPSFNSPAVPTPPPAAPWPLQGAPIAPAYPPAPTAAPPYQPVPAAAPAYPPNPPHVAPVAAPPTAMPPTMPQVNAAAPPMFTTPPMVHPVTTPSVTQPPVIDPAAAAAQHAAADFGTPAAPPATAPVLPTPPAAMPPAPAASTVPVYQPGQSTGLPAAPGAVAPVQPAVLPTPPGLSNLAHLQNLAQQPAKPPAA